MSPRRAARGEAPRRGRARGSLGRGAHSPGGPRRVVLRALGALFVACACVAWAKPGAGGEIKAPLPRFPTLVRGRILDLPGIRPGAIEVGLAGSLTSVEGARRAEIALRAETFRAAGAMLSGLEGEVSYSHVSALDMVGLEGGFSVQRAVVPSTVRPFVVVAGGVRQESIGSFRQARYPIGFDLGARMLVSERVAFRAEYRFRRVLRDPVADFTEHELRIGASVFFRNGP